MLLILEFGRLKAGESATVCSMGYRVHCQAVPQGKTFSKLNKQKFPNTNFMKPSFIFALEKMILVG